MNRQLLLTVQISQTVYRLAHDIENSSSNLASYRHLDRLGSVDNFHSSLQSVRGIHSDCPDCVFTYMLLHFHYQFLAIFFLDGQCVVNVRKFIFFLLRAHLEMHVHNRTNNLRNMSYNVWHIIIN